MKRITLGLIAALLLLSPSVLADDPKPVDAGVVDAGAQPADVIGEAEKVIADGIKEIDKDPGKTVGIIMQLVEEGRWGPAIGLALMFLIWILRKFIWKLIPKNALPWVTLGAGMAATAAIELSLGIVWWKVLIDSLGTSGIAMGLWSLIFKHFMKPKEENA